MPRDAPVTSTARCTSMLPQGLGIAVLRIRVTPARHVVGEPARGVEQDLTQAGVPLHEAGQPPGGQPGPILPAQALRVAVRPAANAAGRAPHRRRDPQILVWQDMAGLTTGRLPRFVKRYA